MILSDLPARASRSASRMARTDPTSAPATRIACASPFRPGSIPLSAEGP